MKIKLNIKNVLILSILAIFITSISLFFINTSLAANTAKVIVQTANLREEPSADSKILELIGQDQIVEILETSGEWYKVKHNNITGYLRNDLVQLENAQVNTTVENNAQTNTTVENNTIAQNETNEQNVSVENTQIQEQDLNGKYKAKENTTIKVIPLIHALDIENINKDTELEVTETMNNWACVNVNGKQGWIVLQKIEKVQENEVQTSNEPVVEQQNTTENNNTQANTTQEEQTTNTQNEQTQTTAKIKYTNSQTINLRSSADTNSAIITQIAINTQVEVVSEENGWSKVNVDGKQGYILSSLLSDRKQETSRGATESRMAETNTQTENNNTNTNKNTEKETTTSNTENKTSNSNSTTGDSVVAYAKQFIGVKYKYGGTSPSAGFDCSGFTSYVYKHFGISLPRTSGGQSGAGKAVSRANMKAGDLAIYNGHVAIYVGGGKVIHAPRPGKSVCIVSLDQAGYGFSGGRRIL